jgi:hypothetical protein
MQNFNPEKDYYDGFIFLHSDEDEDELDFRFIRYNQNFGECIENTKAGDKYHVAFFKRDVETGEYSFDETFEAIFADPLTYAKNLRGCQVFGTILKKKEKTTEWFNDYLTDLTKAIKMTGK